MYVYSIHVSMLIYILYKLFDTESHHLRSLAHFHIVQLSAHSTETFGALSGAVVSRAKFWVESSV